MQLEQDNIESVAAIREAAGAFGEELQRRAAEFEDQGFVSQDTASLANQTDALFGIHLVY